MGTASVTKTTTTAPRLSGPAFSRPTPKQRGFFLAMTNSKTHLVSLRIRRDADTGRLVARSAGQPLEELLRDERHEGMNESQPDIQTRVQHVSRHALLILVSTVQHRLQILLQQERFVSVKADPPQADPPPST